MGVYNCLSSDPTKNKSWQQPPDTEDIKRVASLLYREAVGHLGYSSSHVVIREDDPATPESEYLVYGELAPVPDLNNPGQFLTAGAFGSPPAIFARYSDNPVGNNFMEDFRWVKGVYLECDLRVVSVQDEAARVTAIDAFRNEYGSNPENCAISLVEIVGLGDWVVCGYDESGIFRQIEISDANDPARSLRDKLTVPIVQRTKEKDEVITQSASIIARAVTGDYLDIELASVDQFLAARSAAVSDFDWPAFKERLEEMNHKYSAGSRTGDIITIMDGRKGYLTVNYADESYPGWHGGPTISESSVPLVFGMPGTAFVDLNGSPINTPARLRDGFAAGVGAAGIKSDGYLRNWHLTPILREIVSRFRDE